MVDFEVSYDNFDLQDFCIADIDSDRKYSNAMLRIIIHRCQVIESESGWESCVIAVLYYF